MSDAREFAEEPEVAGEFADTPGANYGGDIVGDDDVIEVYEVSGDEILGDDELGWLKRGKLASRILKARARKNTRVSGDGPVEISGDEVLGIEYSAELGGFSFKKLKKKFKKVAKVAINPVAQAKLALKVAKKGVTFARKNPLAVVAPGVAASFKLFNLARKGASSALSKVMKVKEEAAQGNPIAEQALENLEEVNEIQQEAAEEHGDSHYYDPEDTEAEVSEEYEEEPTEVLGFSFKKLIRKAGRAIDPMRKGSITNSVLPPQAKAAINLVNAIKGGSKSAQDKANAVNAAAAAGNPTAQQAAANIAAAQQVIGKPGLFTRFWRFLFGSKT